MADADEQTAQKIRKLAHDWLDAVRKRDNQALDVILADDFLISGWQPDGQLAGKRFYIEDCLKDVAVEQSSYRFSKWKIRVYGELAIVNCGLEVHAILNKQNWGGEFVITDVWIRQGGAWRVLTRHTSPIIRSGDEKGLRAGRILTI